jgi:hypothetical protein
MNNFKHTQNTREQASDNIDNMTREAGEKFRAMFENGSIQRGAASVIHKGTMVGGAVGICSLIASGMGAVALGAVAVEQMSHKFFETYFTRQSHNNTICFAVEEIQLIMKMCKEEKIDFAELSLADVRAMHDSISRIVEEARRKGVDRYK